MIWKINTYNDSKYINIFIQADCLATMAGYCTNDDMQTMFADCFDSLMEECCGVMNDCDEQKTGFKKMCKEKGYPKLVNTSIELGIHIDPTCCHEAHELMVAAIEKYFPDVVRVEPIFDHEDMEEDHKNVLLATDDKGETALYIFMVEENHPLVQSIICCRVLPTRSGHFLLRIGRCVERDTGFIRQL